MSTKSEVSDPCPAALTPSAKPAISIFKPSTAKQSSNSLNPVSAQIPAVSNPFADFAGRCFMHVALWVERYVSWRQRVPVGDSGNARSYRDFAELVKAEVESTKPKVPQLTEIPVPTTSEVVTSTLLPLQPAASGSAATLEPGTDLLLS
jgi:hypothetical protein